MTDQKLVDALEKALRDEAYDGGFGYMGDEQFTAYVRTLAETAAEVVEKAHTPTDDEKIQWRPVVGYEGMYEVSEAGDVRSLARTKMRRDGVEQVPEPPRIGCNICGEALPDGEPHICSEPQGEPSSEVPEPSADDSMSHYTDPTDPFWQSNPEPQGQPSDAQEAIRVASPDTWDWDACVVCGSKDVTDRGMVVLFSAKDGVYVSRVAWCDQSQECRDDLRQAGASMLTDQDAKSIDAALRAAGGVR